MCVLLGNLLENAIEGATTRPEGERSARVICHISGDMLCLVVENGFDGRVRRKKEGFLSTKHPGRGTGFIRCARRLRATVVPCRWRPKTVCFE